MNEHDPKLIEACAALLGRLKVWWETRRKGGTLVAGELPKQKDEFLKDHPEYEEFRDDIEPYYVTAPGSYQYENFSPHCCSGFCMGNSHSFGDRVKVRSVAVRPFDWDGIREIAHKQISDETVLRIKPWLERATLRQMSMPTPPMPRPAKKVCKLLPKELETEAKRQLDEFYAKETDTVTLLEHDRS